MLRRLALAGMVALLVGGAACAQTPEPETPEPAQDDLFGISIEALRTRANAGDAEAQHTLGMRHFTGFGVPQDDVAAAAWHRQAEKQGHEDAQFYFGAKYANGEGVRQDYAEALVWLNRAIDNTVPSKREEYAEMRDQVQGFLDVNESKRTRAEAGDPNAQYDLARDYRFGNGVPQNYAEALVWYRRAADNFRWEGLFSARAQGAVTRPTAKPWLTVTAECPEQPSLLTLRDSWGPPPLAAKSLLSHTLKRSTMVCRHTRSHEG